MYVTKVRSDSRRSVSGECTSDVSTSLAARLLQYTLYFNAVKSTVLNAFSTMSLRVFDSGMVRQLEVGQWRVFGP